MRGFRSLLAGAALAVGLAGAAIAAEEHIVLPHQKWSFDGLFGTVDIASAQRGLFVYQEVCSTCHGMKQLSYRHLTGLKLTEAQVKALAATVTVPSGLNDQGEPVEGPGLPSSRFREPWPNETAARARYNGSVPPDLSVIIKAREDGANYLYALMTGYADPPADMKMSDGMNYNKYFPGHQIAMPQPLMDDKVEYADGTKATTDQMARDVTQFLTWAANPEMTERKQIGVRVVLFFLLMAVVTYLVKRRVWADVH